MWAGVGIPFCFPAPPCSLSCVLGLVRGSAVRCFSYFVWSLVMEFIECTVEGLTAYLKTLAADDPAVPMVKLLIESIANQ